MNVEDQQIAEQSQESPESEAAAEVRAERESEPATGSTETPTEQSKEHVNGEQALAREGDQVLPEDPESAAAAGLSAEQSPERVPDRADDSSSEQATGPESQVSDEQAVARAGEQSSGPEDPKSAAAAGLSAEQSPERAPDGADGSSSEQAAEQPESHAPEEQPLVPEDPESAAAGLSIEQSPERDEPVSPAESNPDDLAGAVVAEAIEATSEETAFEQDESSETILAESIDIRAGLRELESARLKAVLEAIIYITDEPLGLQQICAAVGKPPEEVRPVLDELTAEYAQPDRGLTIREIAGGYKMATKPEHHELIRQFVRNLNPPLKLSLPALETLAVIAYKQPVTAPEILEIRGVQGAGVLKTLLDRKLIATAGRKNVIGKPILYKTTKEFLVQFGLKDLSELPTLKEFEELGRLALTDAEIAAPPPPTPEAQADGFGPDPAPEPSEPEDKQVPGEPGPSPDEPEPPIDPPGDDEPPMEEPPAPVVPQQVQAADTDA